jgi:hypothetical protein
MKSLNNWSIAGLMSLAVFSGAPPAAFAVQGQLTAAPEQLGSVEFTNSCAADVQVPLARAVAMLHSFWYEEAGRQFRDVAKSDPKCAIAWWGVAMSHWQPLWEPRGPNPDAFRQGLAAIGKAGELGGSSQERGFINALAKFYGNVDTIDHRDRVLAYEKAMESLHARVPNNTEARMFHALSLLASATSLPPDKTYQRQRKAGELLMPVFRSQPNHPGAAHYIIHAYDYPLREDRARRAACAAHAFAHLHAAGTLGRIHPVQPQRDPDGPQVPDCGRGTARDRLPCLRAPAEGGG